MSKRYEITKAISRTAGRWARFARAQGCRFDVERKAASSVAFTERAGGSSFAIPSKLIGTKQHQRDLAVIAQREGYVPLDLHLDESGNLLALWFGVEIGRVQKKHHAWLMPLLATGRVRCYVIEITGQEQGLTLGCNIVFTGIEQALSATEDPRERAFRVLGKPALAA